MKVRLLGTAAGGGFPQWNCNCEPCRAARNEPLRARPRTQCSAAVRADGERWFVLNASPDITRQIEAFPPLRGNEGIRGSAIEGVLLTDANLDHTLGLLLMREAKSITIHAPTAVREAATRVVDVLSSFCSVAWIDSPSAPRPLCYADGAQSGLEYFAFQTARRPPRFHASAGLGEFGVGYCIRDPAARRQIIFTSEVEFISSEFRALAEESDLLLIDGTSGRTMT